MLCFVLEGSVRTLVKCLSPFDANSCRTPHSRGRARVRFWRKAPRGPRGAGGRAGGAVRAGRTDCPSPRHKCPKRRLCEAGAPPANLPSKKKEF